MHALNYPKLYLQDDSLIQRIRNMVDYSVELESFAGSDKETNPIFKDYHGLLYIRKLAALNSLAAYTPVTRDLVFKLKRKSFVIEKLHLPPGSCASLLLCVSFFGPVRSTRVY